MRLSVAAKKLVFNQKGYITQTFKELKEQFLYAAQEALEYAAPTVPIDTGMARGSFLNLVHLLNANGLSTTVDIPTEPQHTNKDGSPLRYWHTSGFRLPKKVKGKADKRGSLPKTPKIGANLSTSRGQIIKRSGDKLSFVYETNVKHFNINDPELWRSYSTFRSVFAFRLAQFKPPQLGKFILMSNVSGGRQSLKKFSDVQNRTVK